VRPRLFVVTGPSGAGKGTLIRALVDRRPDLAVAVSATTRPRRPGVGRVRAVSSAARSASAWSGGICSTKCSSTAGRSSLLPSTLAMSSAV